MPTMPTMPSRDDAFECLMLPAERVSRQIDPAAGCAPACLEMVLDWEQGLAGWQGGSRQAALSEQCALAGLAEEESGGTGWRTSPAAVCLVLNAHASHTLPSGGRPHRYHVVHGATRDGPLQEVLDWLRGIQLSKERLALPSMVLTRHGSHWMLAVGARMDADGLNWLAMAEPASGRLLGLTAAGVAVEFSANLVGDHPDWYGRFVAVVPSVLRRRRRRVIEAAGGRAATISGEPGVGANVSPSASAVVSAGMASAAAASDGHGPAWSSEEAARVVAQLVGCACEAHASEAKAWLAPLRRVRSLAPAISLSSAGVGDGMHRLSALDSDGLVVAEVVVGGLPARLLQFWIRPAIA